MITQPKKSKKLSFEDIRIKYLGHSGFVITKGKYNIVIDPFLTNAPMARRKPGDVKADDILLTHGHHDHLGDAIEIAQNNKAKITAVFELAQYCATFGVETLGVPIGVEQLYDWGTAHFRPAIHSGLLPNGASFGPAASILLDFGYLKIYHLGDTALHADFKTVNEVYHPDIALIPIGGRVNMDINEAITGAQWLGVKTVIPIHYDLYTQGKVNPLEFKQKIEATTNIECVIMEAS